MKSTVLELKKDVYSEWVLRNALYWISEECEWTLSDCSESWVITLDYEHASPEKSFHRLLNDYLLRERLSLSTERLRNDIALAVLDQLKKRLIP